MFWKIHDPSQNWTHEPWISRWGNSVHKTIMENELEFSSIKKYYAIAVEGDCENIVIIVWQRNGFTSDVITAIRYIISATLDVYNAAIKDLLPTPAKSHYIFNLRDFSRVIRGCALLKAETADSKKVFTK